MKVKKVTIKYGGKVNLGNYNSLHINISFSAILEEGENHKEAARTLTLDAQEAVQERVREIIKRRASQGVEVIEYFAGLPVEPKQQPKE